MAKYKVTVHFPEGPYEVDELYDTYEDAEECALYEISCYNQGGEILYMSNPGDNPWDGDVDIDYDIEEI